MLMLEDALSCSLEMSLFKRIYEVSSVLLIASLAVTNPWLQNQEAWSSSVHVSQCKTSLKVTGHIWPWVSSVLHAVSEKS